MRAIILLILACIWTVASAQVYTWRDASGKIHYSDTPPPGVDAKKVRPGIQGDSVPATTAPGRSVVEREMDFRKRQADADKAREKAEQEKTAAEDSKRNCADAKKQLAALESGQRMSRLNEAGESISLDDEMRAQEIDKARKAAQSWCK